MAEMLNDSFNTIKHKAKPYIEDNIIILSMSYRNTIHTIISQTMLKVTHTGVHQQ